MTTNQYRTVVFSELAAIGLLGLMSIIIVITAIPKFSSRVDLAEAIEHYESSSPQRRGKLESALHEALGSDATMAPALALSGLIALRWEEKAPIALDAYQKLEQSLTSSGKSTGPALNGIGCTILLAVHQGSDDKPAKLTQAYDKFVAATRLDSGNGDAHVNAAICSLYQGRLEQAAGHLDQARKTGSLNYESLVAYHSAMGALLSRAAAGGRRVAAGVAEKLGGSGAELRKAGRLVVRVALARAVAEFRKAKALAGGSAEPGVLEKNSAMAQTRLLAFRRVNKDLVKGFRHSVIGAVSSRKTKFTLDQRHLAMIVVGVSHGKDGSFDAARDTLLRAGKLEKGKMSAKTKAYLGSAFVSVGQRAPSTRKRTALEKDGLAYLQVALRDSGLPPRMKFRARSDGAVVLWRQGKLDSAVTQMAAAEKVLQAVRGTPTTPSKREQAAFYRNLAIMQHIRGQAVAAFESAQKSLKLDPTQEAIKELLGQSKVTATILDPRVFTGKEQPPSMPVVSVRILGGGVAPPLKKDIKVEIDGENVKFTVGPESRIYALPRKTLTEGEHTLTVTVSPSGSRPLTKSFPIKIDYGKFKR